MDIQNKIRIKSEDLLNAAKPLIDAMAELKQEITTVREDLHPEAGKSLTKRYENLTRALNNFIAAL